MLTLYHNDMSVCAQKVRMVLAEKEIEWSGPNLNLRQGEQFEPGFLKLSPKALVPVLVHDDHVINESNAIVEYIDEVFSVNPLMPKSAVDRAHVRKWLIQLDANYHIDIATISFVLAFRYQVLAQNDTPEKFDAFLKKIPDPRRAELIGGMVRDGLDYAGAIPAITAYDKLLSQMDQVLDQRQWLVGDDLSLADIGYAPYITRLDHLNLSRWWQGKPALADWYARICATKGYQKGIVAWNQPKYLELMAAKGEEGWPKFSEILSALP